MRNTLTVRFQNQAGSFMRYHLPSLQSFAGTFITILLILLFSYTAFSKLMDIQTFKAALLQASWIHSYATVLSWLLPATEFCISLLLVFPKTTKAGLWLSAILLTLFTGYLVVMLASEKKLPCSCGGVLRQLTWRQHVLFNSGFLLLNLLAMFLNKSKQNVLLQ